MIWDCIIGWILILSAMLGWSTGLLKSWTVPFSMLIATFISQHVYIDLATLLVEALGLESSFAAFTAYFVIWISIAQYSDILLSRLQRGQEIPQKVWLKLGGAGLGLLKGLAAFVFAAMVAYAHNKIPDPPLVSWQSNWMVRSARDSLFLPRMHLLAEKLDAPLGRFVLSNSAPRLPANLIVKKEVLGVDEEEEEKRGRQAGKALKSFKHDLQKIESSF